MTSAGAYPTFTYHVAGFGGVLRTAPYREDAEDPEALLALARETGARLVYMANPDNPMGSWRRAEEVAALVAGLPEGVVLCLDEAYADFAPAEAIPPLDMGEGRVIRMRTFSSATNFVTIDCGRDGAFARAVLAGPRPTGWRGRGWATRWARPG